MLAASPENAVFVRGCLEFAEKRLVTASDVHRAVDLACRVRLPSGHAIIRTQVLCFLVDGVISFDPVGLECGRLAACVEILALKAAGPHHCDVATL
jgi:cell division ATPase FtsA